ncbi:MAG: gliding motility-associated C-terminal domain-containing protein [Bacteroidales bacterium]|nr:gliding motility-associated C-terminal domain-containing protein [Bacteroidales bacterium]
MTRYFLRNILIILLLFILAPGSDGVLSGSPQENISGTINTYAKVNTIEAPDAVIVDDVTGFNEGDTVLVIQMKGVSIYTTQSGLFGTTDGYLGQPGDYGVGFYEFIVIEQVETGPNRIIFRNNLAGYDGYDVEGLIQVVKVPSFENAVVTDKLTCLSWDSVAGTGGVLALIVNKKLELNADIDVTGKGFTGGSVAVMDGLPYMDPNYYYPESSTIPGRKGESTVSHRAGAGAKLIIADYAKGIGRLYSGGGGATGEYSGGGGGASFGAGGNGYRQRTSGYSAAGLGGYHVDLVDFADRVIMGSGGGGSGYSTGGTGTGGARGGGIVFILTDTLIGNGNHIKANGDSITTIATGNGGAGGGGAAGSLVLSVKSYASSDLNLEAKGGTGGHTFELFGTGGGGGGGLVWINGTGTEPELSFNVDGGQPGKISYPSGASAGSAGTAGVIRTGLNILLNGFLFNTITLTSTNSKIDSICYGQVPPMIIGTEPVGGVAPYTFRWERKVDEDVNWSLVPGSGSTVNLTPSDPETDTVQFRRVITDSNASPASDTSKAVTVIVQPAISNNIIGYDTIICAGQDPEFLVPQSGGPGGGNNIYSYQWIDSTTTYTWQIAPGSVNNADYDPPVLTATTYYSRVIVSGVCVDTSNSVKIEVLPVITNNTIASDQFICYDDLFDDLTGSDPLNGDGTYTYEWISSTDQSGWIPAEGTIDGKDYNPDEGSVNFPGDQYYRRIVKSGYLDCCVDTSAQVLLTSIPAIENNTISADQTICQDSLPDPLLGDTPTGGDGNNYTYLWEDSTRTGTWNLIPGADQGDYYPPALEDTTWYRRIILSSVCDDTSNVVIVNVHPSITNNTVSTLSGTVDTTICSGQTPNVLTGEIPGGGSGTYIYEWEFSTDQESSWYPAPGTNNLAGYDPPLLTVDTWYRRRVISGECAVESNSVKVTVLPPITGNTITSDLMTCFNTQPAVITGSQPAGGNGAYTYLWEESPDNIAWSAAPGSNTGIDYQPGNLTDITYYRRITFSGLSDCCQNISNVTTIGIYQLPTGIITSAQDTICAGSEITVSLSLTGAAPWTVVLNDGTEDLPSFGVANASYDFIHSPAYTSDYNYASIIDANSCEATSMNGSRKVVVYEVPVADPGPDDETCGLEYTLQANPSVGTGTWLDYGGAIVSAADISSSSKEITVGTYGTHTFWWKETNWECVDSASVDITFWEAPSQADAGEDIQLSPYQFEYTLNANEPTVGIGTWTVIQSQGTPSFLDANYAKTTVRDLYYGENILEWTIVNGVCPVESDRVSLDVSTVLIPEGFSPNGDEFNQTFMIEGIEYTENELVVTNLAGAVVYRSTNYNSDWEGTGLDGNSLPEGTYYYYLTIKSPIKERLSGYVIIKK